MKHKVFIISLFIFSSTSFALTTGERVLARCGNSIFSAEIEKVYRDDILLKYDEHSVDHVCGKSYQSKSAIITRLVPVSKYRKKVLLGWVSDTVYHVNQNLIVECGFRQYDAKILEINQPA